MIIPPVMAPRLGGEAAVREMIIQQLAQQRQVTMVELRNSLQDVLKVGIRLGLQNAFGCI